MLEAVTTYSVIYCTGNYYCSAVFLLATFFLPNLPNYSRFFRFQAHSNELTESSKLTKCSTSFMHYSAFQSHSFFSYSHFQHFMLLQLLRHTKLNQQCSLAPGRYSHSFNCFFSLAPSSHHILHPFPTFPTIHTRSTFIYLFIFKPQTLYCSLSFIHCVFNSPNSSHSFSCVSTQSQAL